MTFLTIVAIKNDIKTWENFSDNHFHNILRLFNDLPNFRSPQAKRSEITSNTHRMYDLLHELKNDLRS